MLESLFNKVAGLQVCNFIKKRLQHKCFPVNIEQLLKNICERLLLKQQISKVFIYCSTRSLKSTNIYLRGTVTLQIIKTRPHPNAFAIQGAVFYNECFCGFIFHQYCSTRNMENKVRKNE